MTTAHEGLREALASRTHTNAEDWFLVYRARHGMLVALRELRRRRGAGSVATQLLTCCTAVDPIIAAGLTPVYGDVAAQTLSLDAAVLPQTDDLRAVMMQHTFGYIDQASAQALRAAADAQGALLLEDSAHCVGRMAVDGAGAPIADVSFHSFGVEKMLPTYFGGAVWVSPKLGDSALRADVVAALDGLPEPDGRLARAMRGYQTQVRVLNHLPAPLAHALRSFLVGCGLLEPAIAPMEMEGAVAHDPMAMDEWACDQVLGHFLTMPEQDERRMSALASYARELSGIAGVRVPESVLSSAQPLLRLPVNLADDAKADAAIAAIGALGLYVVPWYRPLLYPGVPDARSYGFDGSLANLPNTASFTRGALALPCDLSDAQVREAVAALRTIVGAQ
ncbi:MAG: DegT/DnrJ/EryC1/StrS family aminotransferase [Acidobacteriota bacterium]|nr:DegT/DnrJ/EryC1/StrS family aminotransferase [Acidobacteriota bacterium]